MSEKTLNRALELADAEANFNGDVITEIDDRLSWDDMQPSPVDERWSRLCAQSTRDSRAHLLALRRPQGAGWPARRIEKEGSDAAAE